MKAIIEHVDKICERKDCAFRPKSEDNCVHCYGCRWYRTADFSMITSVEEDKMTERLKFVGDSKMERYTGDSVDCRRGDIVAVSVAKKAQLLRDFPNWWEEVEGKPIEEKSQTVPETMDDLSVKVNKLKKKADVVKVAKELGVKVGKKDTVQAMKDKIVKYMEKANEH